MCPLRPRLDRGSTRQASPISLIPRSRKRGWHCPFGAGSLCEACLLSLYQLPAGPYSIRASCLGDVAVFSFFRLLPSFLDLFEFGSTELLHLLPHILTLRIQVRPLDRHPHQSSQHLTHRSSRLQLRIHSCCRPQG